MRLTCGALLDGEPQRLDVGEAALVFHRLRALLLRPPARAPLLPRRLSRGLEGLEAEALRLSTLRIASLRSLDGFCLPADLGEPRSFPRDERLPRGLLATRLRRPRHLRRTRHLRRVRRPPRLLLRAHAQHRGPVALVEGGVRHVARARLVAGLLGARRLDALQLCRPGLAARTLGRACHLGPPHQLRLVRGPPRLHRLLSGVQRGPVAPRALKGARCPLGRPTRRQRLALRLLPLQVAPHLLASLGIGRLLPLLALQHVRLVVRAARLLARVLVTRFRLASLLLLTLRRIALPCQLRGELLAALGELGQVAPSVLLALSLECLRALRVLLEGHGERLAPRFDLGQMAPRVLFALRRKGGRILRVPPHRRLVLLPPGVLLPPLILQSGLVYLSTRRVALCCTLQSPLCSRLRDGRGVERRHGRHDRAPNPRAELYLYSLS